jgi:hypothetical protein
LKPAIVALVVASLIILEAPGAFASSQASFNSASSAVQAAFVSVQSAGKDGGNVSGLVAELNGALALIQKASSENSTNPGQAESDLSSAITIAQGVQASAVAVGQQGTAARQFQFELSIGSAIVIIAIAAGLYVYGDRIYRRLWLRMYGRHVVKKIG